MNGKSADTRLAFAAFEGWNDAAGAATAALDHLLDVWDIVEIASLDAETYYDFQQNRPFQLETENGQRVIEWPSTRVYEAVNPATGTTIVIVRGTEPSMRWKSFTGELLDTLADAGVTRLVTLGAMLGDTPHTRPLPVVGVSVGDDDSDRLTLEPHSYEGPIGIVGVMLDAARRRHLNAASLWVTVPQYVSSFPSPKATLSLMERIEELLGESLPLGELPEDAAAWVDSVSDLVENDEEVAEYVAALESEKRTTDLPQASGDAIARDFERYLRRRGPA